MRRTEALVRGVIADVVVPLTASEEPDLDRLSSEVKLLDASGVKGVCVGGVLGGLIGATAGELSTVCATVRRSTRKPLFAMLFPDTSPESIEMLRAVNEAGADAVLLAQPHYLAQPGTDAIEEMFAELREITAGPLLLADCLPGSIVGTAPIRALVDKGLVDGVLEAADMHVLVDLLCVRLKVPVYSGVEDLQYLSLLLGAHGTISNLASVFPSECAKLYAAVTAGEARQAREMHQRVVRLWRGLAVGTEREARLRVALKLRGRPVGAARSPYARIPEPATRVVHSILQKEGLLASAS